MPMETNAQISSQALDFENLNNLPKESQEIEELRQMFKVIISEINELKNQKTVEEKRRLIPFKDVMVILGIGKTKLYDMVSKEEIPFVRIDGSIKFDKEDIDRFIQEKKKEKFSFQINVGELKGKKYIKKK
jgi:excisionase family DNA binding protein